MLEDGARKGAPKIACSSHTRLANHSWRVSHLCGPNKNTFFLTLACWNVRTLIDSNKSERPEGRTALIARELGRYQVDIAALSETRLSDKGHLMKLVVATLFSGVEETRVNCTEVELVLLLKTK